MKKKYQKPLAEIEGFVPNEYVAVCKGYIELPGGGEFEVEFISGKLETSFRSQYDEDPDCIISTIWDGSVRLNDGTVDSTAYGFMGDPVGPYPPEYDFSTNQIDKCEREKQADWQTGKDAEYWAYHYHVSRITDNHS